MSKPFVRGGQTLFHSLHMLGQVLGYLVIAMLLTFIVIFTISLWINTSKVHRYFIFKWWEANIHYHFNTHSHFLYKEDDRLASKKIPVKAFLNKKVNQENYQVLFYKIKMSVWIGLAFSLSVALLLLAWFYKRGFALAQPNIEQGRYKSASHTLIRKMKEIGPLSSLKLAGVPLFLNSECQHILVHGSSGTGKSVAITDLLMQIKKRGDKAIIYDKHGSYVSYFFDEANDILLNPFDKRCQAWHLWGECATLAESEQLAASLIPVSKGVDPFWQQAARSLFASTLWSMRNESDKSIKKLLSVLLGSDIKLLKQYVKGTEVEALASIAIEKVLLSVKSVLANAIKSLRYLEDENVQKEERFSIREWVNQESTQWVFVTSRAMHHEAIKPLLSCWLDKAFNQLLGLPSSSTRRLWFIIDELASLQKLPCLCDALAESRKFGGCIVLGLQNVFQLNEHYGVEGAKSIIDLCNTKLFLRAPSYQCAEWVAKELGMQEVVESREGISYGAHHVRDGVSMQQQQTQKPAVTATELMNLPDLHGFLSIPPIKSSQDKIKQRTKEWPIATCKLQIPRLPLIANGFEEKVILEDKEKIDLKETPKGNEIKSENTAALTVEGEKQLIFITPTKQPVIEL